MPFYDRLDNPALVLHEQIMYHGIPGYRPYITKQESTIIVMARNELVGHPVELEWDYLFFVDDDQGWPRDQMFEERTVFDENDKAIRVPRMIACMKQILDRQKDICCGLYTQRGNACLPLAMKKSPFPFKEQIYLPMVYFPDSGIEEVDAAATGFMCIKHSVFDAFQKDFEQKCRVKTAFENWSQANGGMDQLPEPVRAYLDICKPNIYPPFWLDFFYNEGEGQWAYLGEDVYFCREAQRLGFKIHVDFGVQIGHKGDFFMTPEKFKYAYQDGAAAKQREWFDKFNKQFDMKERPYGEPGQCDQDNSSQDAQSGRNLQG